jgi:NO-binding membrane sensor protein with MHYT domain
VRDDAAQKAGHMEMPPSFSERPRRTQIVLAVVIPLLFGAVAGIAVGISAAAYTVLALLAAVGGVLAGLEHPDPGAGARRVFVGGALFGLGILIAHAIAGTDAKVSLGGFPPLLILIDAIIGAVLGAIGGAISARSRRDRST